MQSTHQTPTVVPATAHQTQKGGPLSRTAAQLCRQPAFQAFCRARNEQEAAEYIRRACGIQSRAQLDHDPKAARLFHDQVRKPFVYGRG
ncbi:hypothetical protein [Bordetella bronchiseptica]|uniref:hypothetical protein n=1 Tax=Bordetella bronchiseptica TaxID=518 RepID=UPI0004620309|nr:hypothetical protein [Bordetella bronchiseptica]KDD21296.1 hypothetical protein L525_3524 [Bordetella bronchiseptica MBORD782]VTQ77851.1 Uncharacterised protein [Bordetella bronchiseptica]